MRRYVWPAVGIAALGQAAAAFFANQITGRMPVHFTFSGEPDNFMHPWAFWWAMVAMQVFLLAMFWWIGRNAAPAGKSARVNIGGGYFVATCIALITAWTFYISAADPSPRLGLGAMLLIMAMSGVVGVVVGALVNVPESNTDLVTYEPRQINVAPGAEIVWVGYAHPSSGIASTMYALAVVLFLIGLIAMDWIILLVALLSSVLMAATLWFTVTLNKGGLEYRSALGLPKKHIPLAEITDITAVDITIAEYGGVGLRISNAFDGRRGLITRSGEGIRVAYGEGKVLEITCSDPRGAAGAWKVLSHRDT
ncbi:Predicted integral membrane protein [Corynebacterium renale]|uniref:DUF1648 domain-containing protein n=1 Tax=Corynebacterium renale TaxID=1724 RepID=UPI000DA3AF96|nr:DUF1648 domain-containing protein [Corynebacterium renale]SQG64549.1 Predicted integral membrane protein [Corynebacterium renale]STC95551.1 Predicted integral membrane protein [Corynebacterium renale]